MRLAFLCLLASAVICWARPAPPPEVDRRTRSFLTETIPKLDLEQVPLRAGVDIIRREWKKRHPREVFPVGLSETTDADGKVPKTLITLKMQNILFADAVRYVGALGRKTLVEQHGLYTLRDYRPEDSDWDTREYFLTSETVAALLGTRAASTAQTQRAFTELGVDDKGTADGPESMKMAWLDESHLVVQAYPRQHDRIRGIFSILGRGYKLVKSTSEKDGE